jgi:hypothetical protein
MKVIIPIVFPLFLTISIVSAIPDPSCVQCLDMGYHLVQGDGGYYCDFGDGNSCLAWEFYRGECGTEYKWMGYSTMYTIIAISLVIIALLTITYFKKIRK